MRPHRRSSIPPVEQQVRASTADTTRTVADLTCVGQRLILKLLVRKWVCPLDSCPQRIFAEQFAGLVRRYAHMTEQLIKALQSIGVTTNGADGACLSSALAMLTTAKTLIRRVLELPLPKEGSVRIAGIDEWASKKGARYGTILVDLFLLVSVLYVISHLFERRIPVSHICFEQTQPCLRRRSDTIRNPQHVLCYPNGQRYFLLFPARRRKIPLVHDAHRPPGSVIDALIGLPEHQAGRSPLGCLLLTVFPPGWHSSTHLKPSIAMRRAARKAAFLSAGRPRAVLDRQLVGALIQSHRNHPRTRSPPFRHSGATTAL